MVRQVGIGAAALEEALQEPLVKQEQCRKTSLQPGKHQIAFNVVS
jgi:hypothetical protein